jgi:uncharacterized membrane protein YtjA (UPF0391 family)
MLHYALTFLLIAVLGVTFGSFGLAGSAATVAKALFFIFFRFAPDRNDPLKKVGRSPPLQRRSPCMPRGCSEPRLFSTITPLAFFAP